MCLLHYPYSLVSCQTRPVVVAYLLSKSNDNPKRCFPNGSPVWRYPEVSPVIVYAPVVVFWSQDKSALLLRNFWCFLFKIGKYICQSLSVCVLLKFLCFNHGLLKHCVYITLKIAFYQGKWWLRHGSGNFMFKQTQYSISINHGLLILASILRIMVSQIDIDW